jgi:replicative DNA helicase
MPMYDEQQMIEPHAFEAEQAALGAAMIDAEALMLVMDGLNEEAVHDPRHKRIWKTMRAMYESGNPIDTITLTAWMQDDKTIAEIGGVAYLMQVADSVPTTANVDYYIGLIIEKYRLRQIAAAQREIGAGMEFGADPDAILAKAQERFAVIEGGGAKGKDFKPIKDVVTNAFEQIELKMNHQGQVTGISSGYPDLDKMTTGFQRSDLIILAARPAVGKTAFALNVAQNIAIRAREPVAIFSLEMAAEQLVTRMMSAEGNVDAGRLRTGMLDEDDWPKLTMVSGTLSEAPIFIDDTPGITVQDIRNKCRRLQAEHGQLGLILIDYLQLIQGRGGNNRTQEVSEISRMLKLIARELHVPVIALSQLSRSVEQRADKHPMMSDLRESGSIEQDADIVSFLYRDDYYNPESERKNVVEVIIAKQRSGPTGTVELVFLKNFNKFVSLERAPGGA